jgi:cell division protein FtsL
MTFISFSIYLTLIAMGIVIIAILFLMDAKIYRQEENITALVEHCCKLTKSLRLLEEKVKDHSPSSTVIIV